VVTVKGMREISIWAQGIGSEKRGQLSLRIGNVLLQYFTLSIL